MAVSQASGDAGRHVNSNKHARVSPTPGGPFAVALADLREAIGLSRVWLHSGWIDVVWRFRRTILGPFWHTLGLAAFVLVMGVIWSKILNQDPGEYFRFVTVSLMIWTLIASIITEGTAIIIAGQSTALSMRFPYIAFAFGHVWRAALLFAHHFVLYVVVMAGTLTSPGWVVLLAIPGLALLLMNGVWMSLLVGVVALRRRDFMPAVTSLMQIMMFVTPVFWPKDMLGPTFAFAADLNPLYHFINIIREPLLGNMPAPESWLWSIGVLVIGTLFTLWFYGRYRDRLSYWY